MNSPDTAWIAFVDSRCIAKGPAAEALVVAKAQVDAHPEVPVYLFDAVTSERIDLDLTAPLALLQRYLPKPVQTLAEPSPTSEPAVARLAGRPKLGVTAREVTLLPRHWEWLAAQRGGASVSLRQLVEQAMRVGKEADRIRLARESAYRFISAMAGDAPGFEEASRALFAGNDQGFKASIVAWPKDVREHALVLASAAATSVEVRTAS